MQDKFLKAFLKGCWFAMPDMISFHDNFAIICFHFLSREMGSFSGEATFLFSFLPPFLMGLNSYRKKFPPLGADIFFNPIALRKAKIVYNFGLFECSRVNSRPPFGRVVSSGEAKQEVTKVVQLAESLEICLSFGHRRNVSS